MPLKAMKNIAKKNKVPLAKVERGFKEVADKTGNYAIAMAAAKKIMGKKK